MEKDYLFNDTDDLIYAYEKEDKRLIIERDSDLLIPLREYIESKIKEVLPESSFDNDILLSLCSGMVTDEKTNHIKKYYYGHIMTGKTTKNPIHDMLFYAIYGSYAEAMYQAHCTHNAIYQGSGNLPEGCTPLRRQAPVPSSTEYLTVFNNLVQTYAQLFPERLKNLHPEGDTEDHMDK